MIWRLIFTVTMTFAAGITDAEYEALCKYDRYCKNLKQSDAFRNPDPSLINIMETLRPDINAAAKAAGVDPRAIAGAVITENTLNVGMSDRIQSLLVETGVTKNGKLFGREFSYGLGQINCSRAFEVEDLAANLYSRPKRTREEICKAITDSKESIKYIGVIIREAVDIYKEHGMDISTDLGVQTTLYNLGKVKEKALAAKASGAKPRVNYFGLFTEKHMDEIEKITGKPVTKPLLASLFKSNLVDGLQRPIDLQNIPPHCPTTVLGHKREAFQTEIKKIKSTTGPAKILSRAVDCNVDSWLLVEDSAENTGWSKEVEFQKNLSKFGVADNRTCNHVDPQCITQLKQKYRRNMIGNNTELGATDFAINNQFADYSSMSSERTSARHMSFCGTKNSTLPNVSFNSSDMILSASDINRIRSQLNAKLASKTVVPEKLQNLGPIYDLYFCSDACTGNADEILAYIADLDKRFDRTKKIEIPTLSFKRPAVAAVKSTFSMNDLSKCAVVARSQPIPYAFTDIFYRLSGGFGPAPSGPLETSPEIDSLQRTCEELADVNFPKSPEYYRSLTALVAPINAKLQANIAKDNVWRSECGMNFSTTVEMINTLANSACADKIYISDPVIYDMISRTNPNQAVYMPTRRSDRVSTSFKELCTGDIKVNDRAAPSTDVMYKN